MLDKIAKKIGNQNHKIFPDQYPQDKLEKKLKLFFKIVLISESFIGLSFQILKGRFFYTGYLRNINRLVHIVNLQAMNLLCMHDSPNLLDPRIFFSLNLSQGQYFKDQILGYVSTSQSHL